MTHGPLRIETNYFFWATDVHQFHGSVRSLCPAAGPSRFVFGHGRLATARIAVERLGPLAVRKRGIRVASKSERVDGPSLICRWWSPVCVTRAAVVRFCRWVLL